MSEIAVSGNLESVIIGATGHAEIIQNVAVILATVRGSVPLDREFGIDPGFLDLPMPVARARITADIVGEVEKQEPRVEVTRVGFEETADASDGILKPMVYIKIKDGY